VSRLSRWCLLASAIGACLAAAPALDAASFTLTREEREAAIQEGRRSVISPEFGGEWQVGGDGPGQTLAVITPFHRLALAARNSAFKTEALRPRDVETLLKSQEGALTLWATLKGSKADFARLYTPALANGKNEIKPSFTQNEHTARREEDGSYTARCIYVFPTEGLKPGDTLMLIVKDSAEKAVARFALNLAAMR